MAALATAVSRGRVSTPIFEDMRKSKHGTDTDEVDKNLQPQGRTESSEQQSEYERQQCAEREHFKRVFATADHKRRPGVSGRAAQDWRLKAK
jgi:hypothetical protein